MKYKTTLRIIVTLLLFGYSFTNVSAQVVQKIGSNSFTINPKAVLELESTTKGFLPPRMTTVQQTTMGTSLPAGLIVYVTNTPTPGLQIWDGTKWAAFSDTEALEAEVLRAKGVESANATAIALNTAKVGITSQQALDIIANNAKTGITSGQASEIAVNTLKVGITSGQASEIALNTLKVGITAGQASEIAANTLKVGITSGQASEIAANTLKVGITSQQALEIIANNAKTGITAGQANEIAVNTLKVGITTTQADAIAANTLKVGISTAQANEITANTLKVGITPDQATAISANEAAVLLKENTANKSTSITIVSNSDIKFPTEKAVIDYVNIKTNTISIIRKTSNYTASDSDNTILCDTSGGTFKLSLPAASSTSGKIYVIRKTDITNNELTFDALTLADGLTVVTSLNYPKTMRVQSDGASWYVID